MQPQISNILRRIPIGITLLLTSPLASACGRGDAPPAVEPAPVRAPAPAIEEVVDLRAEEVTVEEVTVEELVPPELDKPLGSFSMTYYWIAKEPKNARGTRPIFDKQCRPIAKVTREFKRRLKLEGSGKLKDGRLVSAAGACDCGSPCFFVADTDDYEWGAGVASRPLNPFRSVAVDPRQIKIGTSIYVAELDGLTMPGPEGVGGFVHDGCVVADDRGGGVRGKQIDFFAARKKHYRNFFKRHKINKVSVYPGGKRCEGQAAEHASLLPGKKAGQG